MEALFKQYFWVVKGLGLAICAALAASVVTTWVGNAYIYDDAAGDTEGGTGTGTDTDTDGDDEEDEKPALGASLLTSRGTSAPRGTSAADKQKNVQTILGRNLFCPTCIKVVAPDPGAVTPLPELPIDPETGLPVMPQGGPQPGEVPSTLPYRLVATMEASDPKFSWATLRDEETGGAGPYWPGDKIRAGAVLVSVERRMVHVLNGAQREYIELGVEPPKGPVKPVVEAKKEEEAKPAAGGIEGMEGAVRCDSENACTIDRAWLEGVLSNPAALTKQARVMPSVKDGETRGFKFYGIRPNSLPKLLNIKNGDLVTAVNGIELKSMDGAMALYTKLRRASNLSISIERKGETITKEITIQ
jgi:general secretion pathway protein C